MINFYLSNLLKVVDEAEKTGDEIVVSIQYNKLTKTKKLSLDDKIVAVCTEKEIEKTEAIVSIIREIVDSYALMDVQMIMLPNQMIRGFFIEFVKGSKEIKIPHCSLTLEYTIENKFVEYSKEEEELWDNFLGAFVEWFRENRFYSHLKGWLEQCSYIKVD